MGKTTLFHPVSLHVIRGAAEYCGWKFKSIKQIDADASKGRARYIAQIETMPKRVWGAALDVMQNDLQNCFMDDIRIYWLRATRRGVYHVDIEVTLVHQAISGGGGGGGPADDDDWDGLRVCSICEDRYTTEDICHVCAQQIAIDNDRLPRTFWCSRCHQNTARWEGALCFNCWLASRKPGASVTP